MTLLAPYLTDYIQPYSYITYHLSNLSIKIKQYLCLQISGKELEYCSYSLTSFSPLSPSSLVLLPPSLQEWLHLSYHPLLLLCCCLPLDVDQFSLLHQYLFCYYPGLFVVGLQGSLAPQLGWMARNSKVIQHNFLYSAV